MGGTKEALGSCEVVKNGEGGGENNTGNVYSVLEYTHTFFAHSELLIKDYLDNFSFKLYKLLGLKILL
jgi:hypothetical protein